MTGDVSVQTAEATDERGAKAKVPPLSRVHRWAALMVLLFAQFVLSIDLTVLNVALPSMTAVRSKQLHKRASSMGLSFMFEECGGACDAKPLIKEKGTRDGCS